MQESASAFAFFDLSACMHAGAKDLSAEMNCLVFISENNSPFQSSLGSIRPSIEPEVRIPASPFLGV